MSPWKLDIAITMTIIDTTEYCSDIQVPCERGTLSWTQLGQPKMRERERERQKKQRNCGKCDTSHFLPFQSTQQLH